MTRNVFHDCMKFGLKVIDESCLRCHIDAQDERIAKLIDRDRERTEKLEELKQKIARLESPDEYCGGIWCKGNQYRERIAGLEQAIDNFLYEYDTRPSGQIADLFAELRKAREGNYYYDTQRIIGRGTR